jgi:hypothetical protein
VVSALLLVPASFLRCASGGAARLRFDSRIPALGSDSFCARHSGRPFIHPGFKFGLANFDGGQRRLASETQLAELLRVRTRDFSGGPRSRPCAARSDLGRGLHLLSLTECVMLLMPAERA